MHFWSEKLLILAVSVAIISGCTTTARDLPPDYSSDNSQAKLSLDEFDSKLANMTCSDIRKELRELASVSTIQEQDISDKRKQNQVAGYIGGVLFLPALLATDNSDEAKQKIEDINKARDTLYKLQALKHCPSSLTNE